jgi:hypothetical protein
LCVALIFVMSCKKHEQHQVVVAPAPTPLAPGVGLAGQLAGEAGARPSDTTTVEQVVERLKTIGAVTGAPQQSIARTHGASYCANIRSADLYVLVCEYPSAEQLALGRVHTEEVFKRVPDHLFTTTKHTSVMLQWLTPLGQTQASAAAKALADP